MEDLIKTLRHPNTWTISVQLLILYVVSTLLFFLFYGANRKVAESLKPSVNAGKISASLAVLVLAAASNCIGVVSLVLLAKRLETIPPLALVILPLFLILEQHWRKGRSGPEEVRSNTLGAVGLFLGIAAAACWLLRESPWI